MTKIYVHEIRDMYSYRMAAWTANSFVTTRHALAIYRAGTSKGNQQSGLWVWYRQAESTASVIWPTRQIASDLAKAQNIHTGKGTGLSKSASHLVSQIQLGSIGACLVCSQLGQTNKQQDKLEYGNIAGVQGAHAQEKKQIKW